MEKVKSGSPPGDDLQSLFESLRHMTEQLESGTLSLDESMEVYENAIKLQDKIKSILADAERRCVELAQADGTTKKFQ